MSESDILRADARAAVLKALAHPTRIYIVDLIEREGRYCVCDLTERVGVDTSTVSRHLAILKNAGILQHRKEGTMVYYDLACGCIADLLSGLEKVLRSKHERESKAFTATLAAE